jgi:hypothetical protein
MLYQFDKQTMKKVRERWEKDELIQTLATDIFKRKVRWQLY